MMIPNRGFYKGTGRRQRGAVTGVLAMALALLAFAFAGAGLAVQAGQEEDWSEAVAREVNRRRQREGLPPLETSRFLVQQAFAHSRAMAGGKVGFGHDGFRGRYDLARREWSRMGQFGENVAYDYLDSGMAVRVVDRWMKSPVHRKNILGPFTSAGMGAARGRDGKVYFTQVFAEIRIEEQAVPRAQPVDAAPRVSPIPKRF